MDSISLTYLRFNALKTDFSILRLELDKSVLEVSKRDITIGFLRSENVNLKSINGIQFEKFQLEKNKLELDVEFYRKKSKGKLIPYIVGIGVGIVVGAIISL